MPDVATVANRGIIAEVPSGTSVDTTLITGEVIVYGFAWHGSEAADNPNLTHTISLKDGNGKTMWSMTENGDEDAAGGTFTVPLLANGVVLNRVASGSSNAREIRYVLWTDGGNVTATEQQ